MVKTSIINVKCTDIAITKINSEDYISLTDMVKSEEGDDHIRNWMRNKNTIEFLGLWEYLHNPNFKGVEFDTFLNEAGYYSNLPFSLATRCPYFHKHIEQVISARS